MQADRRGWSRNKPVAGPPARSEPDRNGLFPTQVASAKSRRANRAGPLGPHRPMPRRNHTASVPQRLRQGRISAIAGGQCSEAKAERVRAATFTFVFSRSELVDGRNHQRIAGFAIEALQTGHSAIGQETRIPIGLTMLALHLSLPPSSRSSENRLRVGTGMRTGGCPSRQRRSRRNRDRRKSSR